MAVVAPAHDSRVLPGQDCYFYYYSTCSRGDTCPYRHEPLALSNETVCTYWRAGNCNKDHCIFRHLEVGNKKRNVTQCYWETQPQGCTKPHCAFLHQQPKDPVSQPLPSKEAKTSNLHKQNTVAALDAGNIIVNPAKLEKLKKIVKVSTLDDDESGVRRLLVPAGSAHIARQTITGGIKSRLGHSGTIKSRLGLGGDDEDLDEEDAEMLENLRKSAMRTIDLRGRIDGRTSFGRKVVEAEEDDHENEGDHEDDENNVSERKEKLLMREHKIQKLLKKQEMEKLLYKAEKKAKKKEEKRRLKSQVTAVLNNADLTSVGSKKSKSRRVVEELPSASDYSDLESPNEDDSTINVISRTDRGGTLQSDLASVAKTSAKMRLGGGVEDRRKVSETGNDRGDLRSRMKDKRDRIERQSYAARVLGDLMGGPGHEVDRRSKMKRAVHEDERKPGKRSSEQLRGEESSDGDERKSRKRESEQLRVEESSDDEKRVKKRKMSGDKEDSPVKIKKKKKSEKKEKKEKKKSKKSKKIKTADDKNALQMAQEYEPIRSRKLKIKKKDDELAHDDSLSLDISKDALEEDKDQGKSEETGDVMKDLDDFLND